MKIILLGSGSLKIGEAGEFDYSGSQAIKALKDEGHYVILVNPNIATIQTDNGLADKVYFLPVNSYFVAKIIEKERPEEIILSFGGQTALNCGLELDRLKVLEKYNVHVLGTSIETIRNTEDRKLFYNKLKEIDVKIPNGLAVNTIKDAIKVANEINYPVMIRSGFDLGGKGSGIASNEQELIDIVQTALTSAQQVLIEEYLDGWKEIEYEVVRDKYNNCITVCNMENIDPMGIHTGESIVVAPSQTLTNGEYHKLREISIKVIKHLNIVGECNIQFALSENSDDYRVIEVNARLSRSSALASKATGYPLAYVAAKLILGYGLFELNNSITKKTKAFFEPALDYVVVKIPRWDLQKFRNVNSVIGSEMKSVGEVMAIGRKFEETLQKAIRMLNIGMNGLVCNEINFNNLEEELKNPTDKRLFLIAESLRQNYSIDKINELTKIDKWFLDKIKNIVDLESKINNNLTKEFLLELKQNGFSDKQISIRLNKQEDEVRELRRKFNIVPYVKQIDTLAAEYPAFTNYLYLTYNANFHDIDFNKENSVIILGSGAYKIGSSVEFDWCCVNCVKTLKNLDYKTIMINYNPETVSTDYDVCDKLYFDELSFETINEIYNLEKPFGIIISMGGQIPNNLALRLNSNGINLIGTTALSIDNAEDRYKFSKLLDTIKIDQPVWKELTTIEEAINFVKEIEYPVIIRPSYILSGAAMSIAFNKEELVQFLLKAADVSKEHPVVISKFIMNAKEVEIDAVAFNGEIILEAITEHIENAGIHSGDSTIIFPPQTLYIETIKKIKQISDDIAKKLKINGPFNIQFIAKDNEVKVIECNLRASRSFPFVSKISKVNFIDIATKSMLGIKDKINKNILDLGYIGCKAAQFSFSRLKGADPMATVEMTSTGEVACIGKSVEEAFLKSLLAVGFKIPNKKSLLLSIGGEKAKNKLLNDIKIIYDLGYKIYATDQTSTFLSKNNIENVRVFKIYENPYNNFLNYIKKGEVGLVININDQSSQIRLDDDYKIRRFAIDYNVPLITNSQLAKLFIRTISKLKLGDLEILSWNEYN